MKEANTNISVWRILVASICFIFVFTFLFVILHLLIGILFELLDTFPLYYRVSRLPIIEWVVYTAPFFTLCCVALNFCNLLCISMTNRITSSNSLASAKVVIGAGITLFVIHITDMVWSLSLGVPIAKNILPLINAVYLFFLGRRLHADALSDENITKPSPAPPPFTETNITPPPPSQPGPDSSTELARIICQHKSRFPYQNTIGKVDPYTGVIIQTEEDYERYMIEFAKDSFAHQCPKEDGNCQSPV